MPPANVFISYSHKDEDWVKRLTAHCAILRRQGHIAMWYDRELLPGANLTGEIAAQLEEATIFLPMVSPDFLNSAYCMDREMERALERHGRRELVILPIVVRPCDWKKTRLAEGVALPTDGVPISEWSNVDRAYQNIVDELRRLVETDAMPTPAASQPDEARTKKLQRKYRAQRDFDAVDRSQFMERAMTELRQSFDHACAELATVEGLRAHCRDVHPRGFCVTVVNRHIQRGAAHLTMHARSGRESLGDIFYSWEENGRPNQANGWLTMETDGYDLFLKLTDFTRFGNGQRVTAEEASLILWSQLLESAGIQHE